MPSIFKKGKKEKIEKKPLKTPKYTQHNIFTPNFLYDIKNPKFVPK